MVTNQTSPEVLREKARRWIADNGLPRLTLVSQAIRNSELAGDPFVDNPFRRALIAEAVEQGARWSE